MEWWGTAKSGLKAAALAILSLVFTESTHLPPNRDLTPDHDHLIDKKPEEIGHLVSVPLHQREKAFLPSWQRLAVFARNNRFAAGIIGHVIQENVPARNAPKKLAGQCAPLSPSPAILPALAKASMDLAQTAANRYRATGAIARYRP